MDPNQQFIGNCILGQFEVDEVVKLPAYQQIVDCIRRSNSVTITVDKRRKSQDPSSSSYWLASVTPSSKTIDVAGYPDRRRDGHLWSFALMTSTRDHQILLIRPHYAFLDYEELWDQLLSQINIAFGYGFRFSAPTLSSAYFYASGVRNQPVSEPIVTRGPAYERGVRMGKWMSFIRRGDYSDGVFRSIYPINYINQSHLARQIDDLKLDEWIVRNRKGRIDLLSTNLWKWTVEDPSLVESIRVKFEDCGFAVSA